MSLSNKKLDIKEAIALTGYNENTKRNLVSFLINYFSSEKNKLYLFSRNKNLPKLLLLKLIIPVKYNQREYNIHLLIYFPINFPLVQPEIFFEKYRSIKINPNCLNYIDEETLKINYNSFFKWENNFHSFKNLIKILQKQFNNNFPIFTLKDEFDKNKFNNLDCVLREQLCKEIEFKKNSNLNSKSSVNINQILKTEGNSNINKININKINIANLSPKKVDIKVNDINIHKNNKIKPNIKLDLNDINNTKKENAKKENIKNLNSNKINKELKLKTEPDSYDEKTSKECLIKLLLLELYPKISKINKEINASNNNLTKIKTNIIKEISYFKAKEKQTQSVEKSINLLKKEIKHSNSNDNTNIKQKINFSNLNTILEVKNKNYYVLKSQEKVIEEYIIILKKYLEKKKINIKEALKKVRNLSRQIFYIKYKCFKLTGQNI